MHNTDRQKNRKSFSHSPSSSLSFSCCLVFLCHYLNRCSCLMNINSVILHQGRWMAVLRCSMKWTRSLAHYSKSLEGVFGNFLVLTRFRCQLKPTQIFARKYQSIKSWITVVLFLLFLSPASLIIVYPQKLSTQPRTNHFLQMLGWLVLINFKK